MTWHTRSDHEKPARNALCAIVLCMAMQHVLLTTEPIGFYAQKVLGILAVLACGLCGRIHPRPAKRISRLLCIRFVGIRNRRKPTARLGMESLARLVRTGRIVVEICSFSSKNTGNGLCNRPHILSRWFVFLHRLHFTYVPKRRWCS